MMMKMFFVRLSRCDDKSDKNGDNDRNDGYKK